MNSWKLFVCSSTKRDSNSTYYFQTLISIVIVTTLVAGCLESQEPTIYYSVRSHVEVKYNELADRNRSSFESILKENGYFNITNRTLYINYEILNLHLDAKKNISNGRRISLSLNPVFTWLSAEKMANESYTEKISNFSTIFFSNDSYHYYKYYFTFYLYLKEPTSDGKNPILKDSKNELIIEINDILNALNLTKLTYWDEYVSTGPSHLS